MQGESQRVETTGSTDAPDDESPQPLRLRLAHYLLFATVLSGIGAMQSGWPRSDAVPVTEYWLDAFYLSVMGLLYGTAFTAVLILVRRSLRFGRSGLKHPGHWLLAFIAAAGLVQGTIDVSFELWRPYEDSPFVNYYRWSLYKLLQCSIVGVMCLIFAWLMGGNGFWRSVLTLAGVGALALVPQHVLVMYGVFRPWYGVAHNYACLGVSAATLPLLFFACRLDKKRQIERDWLHWTGALAVALAAVVEGGFAVYYLS